MSLDALRNRLAKNDKRLGAWARRHGITCYRVFDRDIPEHPLAIDRYEDWLVCWVYESRHGTPEETAARTAALAAEVLGVDLARVVVKRRMRVAGGETRAAAGSGEKRALAREAGLSFELVFDEGLDVGLFLDHRPLRAKVRAESRGARVLNLFSYTGSFSVNAAAGGAERTVSVDLSPRFQERARASFERNGLWGPRHTLVVADVSTWLRAGTERFDIIVLDPPTVSKARRADQDLDIQRDHPRLIADALDRLASSGVLYFSTNFQGFSSRALDALRDVEVIEITDETIPVDFPRRPPVHRTWRIRR